MNALPEVLYVNLFQESKFIYSCTDVVIYTVLKRL